MLEAIATLDQWANQQRDDFLWMVVELLSADGVWPVESSAVEAAVGRLATASLHLNRR